MPHIKILSETFAYSKNGITVDHYVKDDVVEVDESTAEQFIARNEAEAVDASEAKSDKVVLENKIEKLDGKIANKKKK